MELTGVIEGLLALNEPCKVELTTDSRYVSDSVSKKWVYSWQKNNWIKNRSSGGSGDKAVPNADLWQKLLPLLELHTVEFNWIRGHTGHTENERCDALAVSQREKFKGGS
jgi:ribonuclease HI